MAGLTSRNLRSSLSFLLINTGWIVVLIFKLRSVRRFFTILAETWSLNGMTTRMGAGVVQVDGICCWSATLESTLWSFVIMLICRDYRNQIVALLIHFALRMVSCSLRADDKNTLISIVPGFNFVCAQARCHDDTETSALKVNIRLLML